MNEAQGVSEYQGRGGVCGLERWMRPRSDRNELTAASRVGRQRRMANSTIH